MNAFDEITKALKSSKRLEGRKNTCPKIERIRLPSETDIQNAIKSMGLLNVFVSDMVDRFVIVDIVTGAELIIEKDTYQVSLTCNGLTNKLSKAKSIYHGFRVSMDRICLMRTNDACKKLQQDLSHG